MRKKNAGHTPVNTELDSKIRQMRTRLQQLDAETSRRYGAAARDTDRQAREIVSRAQAQAADIQNEARKEFAQISRNECSAVVISRQKMEREIAELQKEKESLRRELQEISDQVGRMSEQAAAPVPQPVQEQPAQPVPQPVQEQPAQPVPQPVQPAEVQTAQSAQPAEAQPAQSSQPVEAQPAQTEAPTPYKTSEEQFREALLDEPKKSHWKGILATVIILVLLALLAFELLFGVTTMRDEAMEDSVHKGDKIVYSRLSKQPHTNDLTVFENDAGLVCVRRAIARGGDTVDYDPLTNRLLVNDKAIPNVPGDVSWRGAEDSFSFPVTVQEGEVFVLSSDRAHATNEGLIKVDRVKGKVIKVF